MSSMSSWNFNGLSDQEYDLIPANTVAKAIVTLKPGDSEFDPYLKKSKNGNHYLDLIFTITEGEYSKRKIFHKQILISSNKSSEYFGKLFIKHLLESANRISKKDTSPEAEKVRVLKALSDLDGLEVVIKIGIEPEGEYPAKNKIADILTIDSMAYKEIMDINNNWQSNDDIPF